eukprot:scaffold27962_cov52-Attheya_sp.AAC.3
MINIKNTHHFFVTEAQKAPDHRGSLPVTMMRSSMRRLLLIGLYAIYGADIAVAAEKTSTKKQASVDALVDWIRSRGGFINDRQEVRPVDPNDPASDFGIFATEDIEEDTILLSIPWDLILKPEAGLEYNINGLTCEAAKALAKEIRLGDSSEFSPFIGYLLDSHETQALPETFSDAGIKLLQTVLGKHLSPKTFVNYWMEEWHDECKGGNEPIEETAAMITVQNAEDDLFVPFFNFYAHRNGKYLNTDYSIAKGNKVEVTAERDIEAGEQIYNSFNMCSRCGGRSKTKYGTAELFRDYGMIEPMPQVWKFTEKKGVPSLVVELERDEELDQVKITLLEGSSTPSDHITYLRRELDRILEIKNQWKEDEQNNNLIPAQELNIIWKYHSALNVALTNTIDGISSDDYSLAENYDDSDDDDDETKTDVEIAYWVNVQKCYDEDHYLNLTGFDWSDHPTTLKSNYQTINYYEKTDTKDKCFDLDDTVQICANYRPHYHEPFVHFTSAFFQDLRRVVFVGGGDSMLLHEILKYPNIELVAGLELDQKVVRNSFKHFNTQPHFDDKRVQWWFGDATKSMTIVPQEWYGSFDLVLVDLSETVMSFTVTKDLDMLEALALLLKPDGIFVKNELYFDKLSTIFDYTAQLILDDTPMICKQDFVMGSNRIDFLHPNFDLLKNDNIETLLYKPLENPKDHYDLIWDYRRNDAVADGKCELRDEVLFDPDEQRRAGLMLVLEAEEASAPLKPVELVEETLRQALQNAGLTPKSTVSRPSKHGGSDVVMVMKEGYVVAHTWPEYNYCALEIQLWAAFDKLESVESSLVTFMGSTEENASSFRVVAGGMLGTDTWKEDLAKIGPRYVNTRNCEKRTSLDQIALPTTQSLMEETLNLVKEKDLLVVVLCGNSVEGSCASLKAVKKDKAFSKIVALWTCPSSDDSPSSDDNVPTTVETTDGVKNMVICGETPVLTLKELVEEAGKIGLLIIDPSTSSDWVNNVELIWRDHSLGKKLLNTGVLLMIPELDESRSTLMRRSRYMVLDEHVEVVNYTVSVGPENEVTVGLMASDRTGFLKEVVDLTSKISEDTGANAFVSGIKGDTRTDTRYDRPHFYTVDDYPTLPALQQFSEQRPLASQTIFQLDGADGLDDDESISLAEIISALDRTLSVFTVRPKESKIYDDMGDGALIVHVLTEGHVIVLWDGGSRVDLNILTYDESVDHMKMFAKPFMKFMEDMKLVLHDEMPRGTGRVVNFLKEAGTRTPGCWDNYELCKLYSSNGDCVSNEKWMGENCRKTCGICGVGDIE